MRLVVHELRAGDVRAESAPAYDERTPEPALTGRVRTVWVQQAGARPYVQRDLPTGGVELHCPLGGAPRLVGPLTGPCVHVLPPYATVVGARFWPGAAAPLLGLPAGELLDLTVPAAEVWADAAVRLGELLAAAPGPDAALATLQRFLLVRLRRAGHPDPLVAEATRRLMPWRPVEVGALPADLAISSSQLRRRFGTAVGVGPKVLQRTLRFQGYLALAQAAAGTPETGVQVGEGRVADLAAAAGYADHAHLARECLRLTGVAPRELLGRADDRCGCGHDHAASYGPFLALRSRVPRVG